MFSFQSPHREDSNEYTQHTIINIKMKFTLNYPKYDNVCSDGMFSWGLKNEFEIAVVNETSVFESFKFYCILSVLFFLTFTVQENAGKANTQVFLCVCGRPIRAIQRSVV